ncbi:MAG: SMC-Scp complex subunit ScpB [Candidatus Moranbacteria bacterium]|jgi:segregation and condensation protein B|nr:SMC-Scp complex subunit ScpB [Candidatus Moranbacteria bacterium]
MKKTINKTMISTRENVVGKLEALIFAAGEPVKISKLAKFLKITPVECLKELVNLSNHYDNEKRGFKLLIKEDAVQLASSPIFGDLVAKFFNKELNEELSKAAKEVLAVIAYRGPISRTEIEYIRGVNCSFTLRNLTIRGLIERKENPSNIRSYLYEVSFDFLASLGISKVEELEKYAELSRKEAENKNNAEQQKE